MRVLIIEDDAVGAEFLQRALRESGHVPLHARDGEEGLHLALEEPCDVMVVDRMLPGRDGLEVIRLAREGGVTTPVLILSALGEVDDRVRGLRAGGDDYLVKPYALQELLARLDALVRRTSPEQSAETLQVGDLVLDRLKRKVSRGERDIALQPKEFRLLEYLMLHAGRVVTRTMLLENVWDYHFDPQTNVIDVHISRLRRKVDRDEEAPLIHTLRGAGYCLRESE
ncbi:MAG: response regulator transcription factor [Gammaproteobacteria bacterium]|jgi:two-component system OmpR family response regulator